MFLVDMSFTDMEKITPALTDAHRQYLRTQYESSQLLFGGRKEPRTGGMLISAHSSKQELLGMLSSDPFIKSGAVSYSITEFTPVMASQKYMSVVADYG
ncbi:YciI family protein [Aestuariibacter sp. AA17]|uniref:YciI family protein n=1 Tax=Fluctibacter corallii TaxID=2984329 RepID=A0ABT3AB85_9ALTE|nr:YciI family protein [Aestuariibacter sp. AA17]MCV2885857.1 YciI family protein [Aestuariibacter sp. AA17]